MEIKAIKKIYTTAKTEIIAIAQVDKSSKNFFIRFNFNQR